MILHKASLNMEICGEQKKSTLSRHVTLMQFFVTILKCYSNISCANNAKVLARKLGFNSRAKVSYKKKHFPMDTIYPFAVELIMMFTLP